MATVTLKNVKKTYDNGYTAVHNVNLEIKDGEFIVLVGPSGCGKSTTLRMIAGLEEITDGDLTIDDEIVNDIAPKDRDIAMVFQSYALYPHMTVRQNMEFPLELRKMSKSDMKAKVDNAADILGITEFLENKPKELSGGQRQRVAIGRAIVREPKVLLMDEPLSNLDAKLRNQMRAEIIKLRKRINSTFVYVTHDQTEAMTLGDRIVIMKKGYVNQIGTPQELFNYPVNLFVAGFIGTPQMNFINDSKLELDNGVYYANIKGVSYELSPLYQKVLTAKNQQPCDIVAGIRPEHIKLGSGSLQAKIEVSEMMGSQTYLHCKSGDDDIVIVALTLDLPKDILSGETETLNYTFPADLIQIFDKETENNLIWYDPESAAKDEPVCMRYDNI